MESIAYDFDKGTVKQYIDELCESLFTGTFDEVIAKITSKKYQIRDEYLHNKKCIPVGGYVHEEYCDGTTEKEVSFDDFVIEQYFPGYDNGYNYFVFGIRKILPEEYEAIENKKKNKKQKEIDSDKRVFEELKKKHGWN